jgi:glycerate 2-kinase
MKILIAPDSFKDSMDAAAVAHSIEKGIFRAIPSAEIKKIPMADGGEGFVKTMLQALGGTIIQMKAHDPLMRWCDAFYGILDDGTAVIEMAAASGIELLKKNERNPMVTTTFGTGELMANAMEKGCRNIIVGIGGSATNDGGTGMARALGYRFLDKEKNEIGQGGGSLGLLHHIEAVQVNPLLPNTRVVVACDVTNPLTGKKGASVVYGPQKGASPKMVNELDENLAHLAGVIKKDMDKDVRQLPGGGAAGGLGAGLVAFAGAQLQPGFDIVKQQTQLEGAVQWADVVITGEGKIDAQTLSGKTPWGVAQLARKHNKPLIAIAGNLGEGHGELYAAGFTSLFAIPLGPATLKNCLQNAPFLIESLAERIARLIHH